MIHSSKTSSEEHAVFLREPVVRGLAAGVLIMGALIRLIQYLANRSLWLDEASLALSFFDRGYSRLLAPLAHGQVSPLGFNVLTETVVCRAGLSEWALRFFPLVAGLAGLAAFWQFSKRWLAGGALLFAIYAFAISATLIYYSAEFKPYIVDVLGSIVVSWATLAWWEGGTSRRHLPWLAGLGAVTVWFSFPVVFVLGGVGGVLMFALWRGRRYPQLIGLGIVAAIWLASFSCQYLLFARHAAGSEGLAAYWRADGGFMPFPPWKPATFAWLGRNFFAYFEDVAGLHRSRNILQFIFLVGVIEMVRRRATVRLCALLAPVLLALLASGLERYPFQGRLALFSVPLVLVVCGEGMHGLLDRLRHPALQAALVAVALFSPSAYSLPQLWRPVKVEEVRPLVEHLQREAAGQEVVLVFRDNASFAFYARQSGLPVKAVAFDEKDFAAVWPQVATSWQSSRRSWLVLSHVTDAEREAVLALLRPVCRAALAEEQVGAQLFALGPPDPRP